MVNDSIKGWHQIKCVLFCQLCCVQLEIKIGWGNVCIPLFGLSLADVLVWLKRKSDLLFSYTRLIHLLFLSFSLLLINENLYILQNSFTNTAQQYTIHNSLITMLLLIQSFELKHHTELVCWATCKCSLFKILSTESNH